MRGSVRVHVGIGIFSQKFPFISTSAHAYVGRVSPILDLDGVAVDANGNTSPTDLARLRQTESRIVVFTAMEVGEVEFKIGTTHGAWVPNGLTDDHQRVSARKLLSIVQEQGPLVMAGDFNAVRGGEIYEILTEPGGLEDCVPLDIVKTRDFGSSTDAPDLVVDYFFKQGEIYKVADVKAHTNVSDHYALSATVSKE
jgi:endonuclease/exonuclease/phosphatase family metal-dependent hydrolase